MLYFLVVDIHYRVQYSLSGTQIAIYVTLRTTLETSVRVEMASTYTKPTTFFYGVGIEALMVRAWAAILCSILRDPFGIYPCPDPVLC